MALSARPSVALRDFIATLSTTGVVAPLTGAKVTATPTVIPLFIRQVDGSFAAFTQPTQESTVDRDGAWAMALPVQSDCNPATVLWQITLPDGSVYAGAIVSAMLTEPYPLSINDLVSRYGWGYVASTLTPVVTIQGAQGVPGTGVQIKGTYDPAVQYVANDVVSFTANNLTSSYFALGIVPPGNPPPDPTYWQLFVSAGPQGLPGTAVDATDQVPGSVLVNRGPQGGNAHPVVPVLSALGVIVAADLPVSTVSAIGVVKPGPSLQVANDGSLDVFMEIPLTYYGTNVGQGNHTADEAAMDAFMAQTTYKHLFIPEGSYHFTKAYTLGDRHVRGAGIWKTFIFCDTQLGATNGITSSLTGTFTLTHTSADGVTTATTSAISVLAAASTIQTALSVLSNVPAPSDVSVTGPDGGPWVVNWQGNLANTKFAALKVNMYDPATHSFTIGPYVAASFTGNTGTDSMGSRPELHVDLTVWGGNYGSVNHDQQETLTLCNTPKAFLTTSADSYLSCLSDMSILGPNPGINSTQSDGTARRGQYGTKMANCDGLAIKGQSTLFRVTVGGFDYGIILANYSGHEVLDTCQSRGNYYGVYDLFDGGDVHFEKCLFDSNFMASFGIGPENNNGLSAATLIRCHLGISPYVFYGEHKLNAYQLLAQVHMINCPCEAVGNGVIYSEGWDLTGLPGQLRNIKDVIIERSGFYWDGSHRLPASWKSQNYCFQVSNIQGTCRIVEDWEAPFTAGVLGTWYINSNDQGQMDIYGGGPDYHSIGSDHAHQNWNDVGTFQYNDGSSIFHVGDHDVTGAVPARFYLHRSNASAQGSGTILAGQTFVDMTFSDISPEKIKPFLGYNIQPIVTATIDPVLDGVAGKAFTLVVTNVTSIPGIFTGNFATVNAGTKFRVSVLGGTPTVNLTFNWRIR
jgi:hypothetical protein